MTRTEWVTGVSYNIIYINTNQCYKYEVDSAPKIDKITHLGNIDMKEHDFERGIPRLFHKCLDMDL